MDEIEAQYLNWLLERTQWLERYPYTEEVARAVYSYPFRWFIPNDDNRGIDGLSIRSNWYQANAPGVPEPPGYCGMFEMVLALAERMENDILYDPNLGDRTAEWFWLMMGNCGVADVCGAVSIANGRFDDDARRAVVDAMDGVIFKETNERGWGGLFPLLNPDRDQRTVEIWDQMQAYLNEHPEIT